MWRTNHTLVLHHPLTEKETDQSVPIGICSIPEHHPSNHDVALGEARMSFFSTFSGKIVCQIHNIIDAI